MNKVGGENENRILNHQGGEGRQLETGDFRTAQNIFLVSRRNDPEKEHRFAQ